MYNNPFYDEKELKKTQDSSSIHVCKLSCNYNKAQACLFEKDPLQGPYFKKIVDF